MMRAYYFTRHASERQNKRGIRKSDVAALLTMGNDNNGRVWLSSAEINQEIAVRKDEIACLERLRGKVVIVDGNAIITVYRKDRRRDKNR